MIKDTYQGFLYDKDMPEAEVQTVSRKNINPDNIRGINEEYDLLDFNGPFNRKVMASELDSCIYDGKDMEKYVYKAKKVERLYLVNDRITACKIMKEYSDLTLAKYAQYFQSKGIKCTIIK